MHWPVIWGDVLFREPKVKDAHDLWRGRLSAFGSELHGVMAADGWTWGPGPRPHTTWWRWGN